MIDKSPADTKYIFINPDGWRSSLYLSLSFSVSLFFFLFRQTIINFIRCVLFRGACTRLCWTEHQETCVFVSARFQILSDDGNESVRVKRSDFYCISQLSTAAGNCAQRNILFYSVSIVLSLLLPHLCSFTFCASLSLSLSARRETAACVYIVARLLRVTREAFLFATNNSSFHSCHRRDCFSPLSTHASSSRVSSSIDSEIETIISRAARKLFNPLTDRSRACRIYIFMREFIKIPVVSGYLFIISRGLASSVGRGDSSIMKIFSCRVLFASRMNELYGGAHIARMSSWNVSF